MSSGDGAHDSGLIARDSVQEVQLHRRHELFLFLFLAVVIWPFIAVGVVSGWGFLVWMYYIFTGPPGPA